MTHQSNRSGRMASMLEVFNPSRKFLLGCGFAKSSWQCIHHAMKYSILIIRYERKKQSFGIFDMHPMSSNHVLKQILCRWF